MKLYSDFADRRVLQICADVLAIVMLIVGIVAAVAVHNAIAAFDAVGRNVEQSGTDLAATMSDIGGNLAGIPLIGAGIRAPFDAASGAGGSLATAGDDWQRNVHALAAGIGWTLALLVVTVLLLVWVRPRLIGAGRRASAGRLARSPASYDLLALRALTTLPPKDLARLHPDVVALWRRGDASAIRQLAALELRASGVRLPAGG